MKENNNFYIGWQDKMSKSNSKFLKKIIIPLFICVPIFAFALVYFQNPINNFKFDFGNITTITGTYYDSPIPMVVADKGSFTDSLSHDIILVGYGKFGAQGIIQKIEETHGELNGKKVELAGTLIYGDGKTVMELTEKEASIRKVIGTASSRLPYNLTKKEINLSGEILDPKCYFGAMKPAEGKIHKSCAIRCISGGIPPIFRTKDQNLNHYYILLDEEGKSMNKEVLPYVAEQISVSGKTNRFSNWDVLYVNLGDIKIN